jgi:signal transduction histidine kinase
LSFSYWTLSAVISTTDDYFVRPRPGQGTLAEIFALEFSLRASWIPLMVLVLWLCQRRPIQREHVVERLAIHGLACAAVIVIRGLWVFGLDPIFHYYDVHPPLSQVMWHSVFNNFSNYWPIAGVAHAVLYADRERRRKMVAADLQAELARAQLQLLKTQLHPHFLFNTLHSISTLMHEAPNDADRMIARLSTLLRQALDDASMQEVSLAHELTCLRPYVEIEQVRFGDRLTVVQKIAPEALDALVPHLLLQPLVENAVRHGISPRSAPGTVTISAARVGDQLRLSICDDGVGLAPDAKTTRGLGLSTTRARLIGLYGADHQFGFGPSPDAGVVVTLSLPFRPSERGARPSAGETHAN